MILTLEEISIIGDEPTYSPYGYVIGEDGKIYSLTQQWCHGVILAILFPDLAKEKGFDIPDEDYNVFEYQSFELDNQEILPAVRVSKGMMTSFTVSSGNTLWSQKQVTAFTKILKTDDISLSEQIETHKGRMSARKFIKEVSA